ncbi:MAG: N-acetyl-gamma-glutamyl-phosphate reductase, partial [Cellulomonadaceae bacterium]|nr:N-acetyl-gamma-glutamyl-phosphate reductase [Cellulomonadaceae bacterium]
MTQSFKVAIAGASGYAGGEFLRLAANHPNLEIGTLTAHSQAGKKLGEVHPHIRSLADREFVPMSVEALLGHDVVVLALPHGASGDIAAELEKQPNRPIIIDLGADHRLIDPVAWEKFYGTKHMGTYTYGLPELINGKQERAVGFAPATIQRDLLANTKEIAVPGCNVIAVTLALQPGIAEGVLDPHNLVAVLVNGYSGAGRDPKPHLIASEAMGSAKPYAVGGTHRHIPEIQQNLGFAGGGHIPSDHSQMLTANDYQLSFTPT